MPAQKKNGVPWSSTLVIKGVGKGSIKAMNGQDELILVGGGENGYSCWARGTEPFGDDKWATYDSPNTSTDKRYMAYGKDAFGNPRWVCGSGDNNREIMWSDAPLIPDQNGGTGGGGAAAWNSVNVTGDTSRIGYCKGKWIISGQMVDGAQTLRTSSDGETWGTVDISGLADISTTTSYGLAHDGAGNWIMTQDDRVYASTDNGSIWFLLEDFNDGRHIRDAGFSNGNWFVLARRIGGVTGVEGVSRASAANSGSWTTSGDLNLGDAIKTAGALGCAVSTGSAAHSTIMAVNSNDLAKSHDSGANFTYFSNALPHGSAATIIGDGRGTWIVGHDGSDISISVDDGATWIDAASEISGGDDTDMMAFNILLPV